MAEPTAINVGKVTPLMWAATEGHIECLKILLAAKNPKAEINARQVGGNTALICAAFYGHIKCDQYQQ